MPESLSMPSLEEATAAYEEALLESGEGMEYLRGRGLDESVVRTARLGLVDNPVPGHEAFKGMICLPYVTPAGVVGHKYRRINDGNPKYTAPTGQRTRMYNVCSLQADTDTIVICEGEFDALIVQQVGLAAVSIPGVNNFKPHFPRVLRGFPNVIVATDNDDKEDGTNPGQDLAARIIASMPHARNVLLPPGMDVNEFFLAEGAEALRARLGMHAS